MLAAVAKWVRSAGLPYTIFLLLLVAITATAGAKNRALVGACLLALALTACWLDDIVRRDRAKNHGARARFVCAIAQLVVGFGFAFPGFLKLGDEAAGTFFFGIALVMMSIAALISEWRQTHWQRHRRGVVLLLAALAVAVAAAVPSSHLPMRWIVGALVIAELGCELLSEDSHEGLGQKPRLLVMGAGAVLVVVALSVLVLLGAEWTFALGVVGVLVLLVALASTDAAGLVLVVFAGVALAWAAAPRGVGTDPHTPSAGDRYYLVLGDSYMSGEGAQEFFTGTNRTSSDPKADDLHKHDNQCRRAPTAWALKLADAQTLDLPTKVLFLPCSGALTTNIDTKPRTNEKGEQQGPAELAQFEQAVTDTHLGRPDFVILDGGGNDVGFSLIGETCVNPGDCAEVGDQFLRNLKIPDDEIEDLAHLGDKLDAMYTRVADTLRTTVGGNVPVVVVPYPVPLAASKTCAGVLLGDREREFIRGFVVELNKVIEAAAKRHGFWFMDTMPDALVNSDRALCGGNGVTSGLNFIVFNPKGGTVKDSLKPTNWTHNNLHPNELGHEAMRVAASTWFRENPHLTPTPNAEFDARYEVRDVNAILGADTVTQCTPAADADCDLTASGWANRQQQILYRLVLIPIVLALIGAWLLIAPVMWFARDRELGIGKLVRCAFGPGHDGPPGPGGGSAMANNLEGNVIVNFSGLTGAVGPEAREDDPEPLTADEEAFLGAILEQLEDAETNPSVLTAPNDQATALFQSYVAAHAHDHDRVEVTALGQEAKYDHRDWHWIKLALKEVRLKLGVPHRDPRPPVPTSVDTLVEHARIALLGDWGTDMYGAVPAANHIGDDGRYDVLLHLGDVYYSGTEREINRNFLQPWKLMSDGNPNAVSRACNSNHEMYSGGAPFFNKTLPAFGQKSTMFALATKSASWLLIGLDSAYHDHDLDDDQVRWVDGLLADHPHHRVVLLSHHQPFSRLSGQGEHLVARLKAHLATGRVFAWYWGHEHLLALYDKTPDWPFYGRCAGHSGFPYNRPGELRERPRTELPHGVWFASMGPLGDGDGSGAPEVPASRILDGPNEYLGDHRTDYGPNGFLRLELRDEGIHEVLLLPDGTVLFEDDLT